MRLGRLAATGLVAGAAVAFAVALLLPRRRSILLDPAVGSPDLGGDAGTEPRHIDVTGAERAAATPVRTLGVTTARTE